MNRLGPALLCVLLLAGCGGEPQAVVVSTPPSTVWDGAEILGRTPLALPVASEDRELTLRLPGYQDTPLSVPAGTKGELAATLPAADGHTLVCTSTPSGASVFLDGERRGVTPLTLYGVDRDTVEVAFRLDNHGQVSQTVAFAGEAKREISAILPDLTEEHYRQRLENEPDVIHHYCDLAHHYIVAHEFAKAMDIFAKGIDLVVRKPGPDDARLWSEINRVTTKQYDYGDTKAVDAARALLSQALGEALARHGTKTPVHLYVEYIQVLDSTNQRQRTQDTFDLAWKRFSGDNTLKRLAKQHRLVIP
jgi:hypothetical protein